MTGPTKSELQQQVDALEAELRAVGNLTDAAKTVAALATWDREAQTISRCVKALDDLTDRPSSSSLRYGSNSQSAQAGRVLQYLASRYGVTMADPDAVAQLISERDDLSLRVAELEAGADRR